MIPTNVAPNQSETNPVITTEEKNNHEISYKYKTGEAAKFSKRPVFNRIVNKLVNAGIGFLMKINDGLFFKS